MADAYDDLVAQYQGHPQQQPAGDAYDQLAAQYANNKQSSFMDAVDSFNNQSRKLANGILQPLAALSDKLGVTNTASQRLAQDTTEYQQYADTAAKNSPIASTVGNVLGALSNTAYASAMTGGLGFGGYGSASLGPTGRIAEQGLLSSATSGAEYGNLGERATGAAIGGLTGAAAQGLLGELAPAALKTGAKKLFKENTAQEAADIINQGGLLTAGTATGNNTLQKGEQYLAQLPVIGAKRNYKNIAEQAISQTKDFLGEQGLPVGKTGIENASMGDLASSIMNEVPAAKQQAKALVSSEYSKFKEIAGATKIPMTQAGKIADDILNPAAVQEGYTAAQISNSQIRKSLENIRDMGKASPETFETIRQDIGSYISDIADGAGDSRLIKPLTQLKKTLDDDFSNFGQTLGSEAETQLKKARAMYENTVAPFSDNKLLRDIMKGNLSADSLLKQAVSNESPEAAQTLMKHLTPQGKEDYTKALLLKAANNSIDDTSKQFSAQQFNKEISKLGETLKALPEETQLTLKGLQATLARADRPLEEFSKTRVMTPTLGAGTLVAVTGAIGSGAATALGGATKAISYMLTNPTMVKKLVQLGGGELKEKAADNVANGILKQTMNYLKAGAKATIKGATPATVGTAIGNANRGYLNPPNNQPPPLRALGIEG